MKLDALTVAYVYAQIRDEWRDLEFEYEHAELSMDYDRMDEINERLPIVKESMRKIRAELAKFERKEDSK